MKNQKQIAFFFQLNELHFQLAESGDYLMECTTLSLRL